MHSVPGYHGVNVFLFAAVPALLVMAIWLLLQPLVVLLASAPADAAEPVIVSLTFDDALTEHALAGDLLAERVRPAPALD